MKKAIIFLSRVGVSGGLLYFIFSRPDLNFREVVRVIRGIQPSYLYLALLAYGLVLLLGSLRWKVLLEAHQIRLTFPRIGQLFFIGLFFNNLLPSLTGGDIVKAYYVSKETSKRAEAIITIVADRGIGWLTLFFLGAGASLFNLRQAEMRGPVLTVLLIFVISLILILSAFHQGIMEKVSLTGRGNLKPSRLRELLGKLHRAFYFYKSCPRVLAKAFFLSLLLQTLIIVINYQIALGLGVRDIGIAYFFLFIPIVSAISSIPISAAGWGVGEMAYKEYFSYVGLAGGISVSISLTLRLMLLAWSLIGLPLYLLHRSPLNKERVFPYAKGL
ncbi:flippase-like domain-containing protein [candidate division NPL-UPA2 bacterium]|nr:flippase-like domain-containing protein [candidate division NPL-UPA2 bacterium]